jgi:hypothetical protein
MRHARRHAVPFAPLDVLAISVAVAILVAASSRVSAAADGPHDACAVLTLDAVQGVFPDAERPRPETSLQDYGIFACDWVDASDRRVVHVRISTGATVEDEIGTFELGMSNPLKPNSGPRHEALSGLGAAAAALIVYRDNAKGIPTNLAIVVVQRGGDAVGIATSEIEGKDRAQVLAEMTQLGKLVLARP